MDPKKLHIIVDNTADMPKEWREEFQIEMLSMPILLGNTTYYEHETITNDFFYAWINESTSNIPMTGCNSPLEWENKIKSVAKPEEPVLVITLASALSGNNNSVVQAIKNIPEYDVHIFDPKTGSSANGFYSKEARLLSNKGVSIEEIIQKLNQLRAESTICFVLDTIRFAVSGGRYGAITKVAEAMIPVKPLVYFQETGEMKVTSVSRSIKKATKRISKELQNHYGTQKVNTSIMYADLPETAEQVFEELKTILNVSESFFVNINLTLSSHIGPGAVGFVVCPVLE